MLRGSFVRCALGVAIICGAALPSVAIAAVEVVAGASIERTDPALDALIAPDAQIVRVATGFGFTEGPLWQGDRLLFTDVKNNQLLSVTADGQAQVVMERAGGADAVPDGAWVGPNGLTLDKDGKVLMAQHGGRRIVKLDGAGGATTIVERFEGKRFNSPNDLAHGKDGALWFTDPTYGLAKGDQDPAREVMFAGVYRTRGGKTFAPIRDLTRPNGIAFSPNGRTLYVSESGPAKVVYAYEMEGPDRVSGRRVLTSFDRAAPGVPDGLKVDSRGNIWATGPGGVKIVAPDGKALGWIRLPEGPANVGWGPGGQLYITAGTSIYRVPTRVPGLMPFYAR